MLKHLVGTKLHLLYLEGGERMSRHLMRSVFSFLTFALFAYLTFEVVKFTTSYLILEAKVGLFVFYRLMALAFFVFFAIISVANVLVAFATVFRNIEAEFLHTLPIKPVEIFLARFLDSFLYSSALMLILVLAAVSGYGAFFKDPVTAILGVLLSILPLILSAACLGAIVLLLALKLSKEISIKTAVVVLSLIYAGGTYMYIRFNNPFTLFTEVMKYYPHIDQYLGALDPKADYLVPSFWSANFFYFAATGNVAGAVLSALIVCGIAALLFVLMLRLAGKYYQEAYWIARHKLFERKAARSGEGFGVTAGKRARPVSLLKRDFLLFVREPSQTFHFAVMVILIGVFLFNLFEMKIYLPDTFIVSAAFTLIFAFNSFLIVAFAVRFVYPMISLEGESVWFLRSSPMKPERLFYSKLVPGVAVLSAIGIVLGYAAPSPFKNFRGLVPESVLYGLAGGIIFPSVAMVFGGAFVDYTEKNPVRVASSHGATVSLLISLGVMVILSSMVFSQSFKYFSVHTNFRFDTSVIWTLAGIGTASVVLARYFGGRALRMDL
jgi:ABC-2 type transport system permease protein